MPDHVQQLLNRMMVLFGAVTPVSSDEVLAIGVQQLGVAPSGEISWDAIRDALIREITFGGTTCPTEEVCRLMAEFLQRLPLPRLVHFLDMILPQMVPVQSPCQSRRRRFASSYRVAERNALGEWEVPGQPGNQKFLVLPILGLKIGFTIFWFWNQSSFVTFCRKWLRKQQPCSIGLHNRSRKPKEHGPSHPSHACRSPFEKPEAGMQRNTSL